jgi:arylsulfatase A-like enzyme
VASNRVQDTWTTQTLVNELWAKGVPAFTTLWLSEPDYAQHGSGPGSVVAKMALKSCDDQLALVLKSLKEKNELQNTDVIVVSDHGFSTVTGTFDFVDALNNAGLNVVTQFPKPEEPGSILMVSNSGSVGFYVTNHDDNIITQLVSELQKLDGTGVIFTKEEKTGTFALKDACIDTADAPDVVVSMKWFDEPAPETGLNGTLISEGVKKKGGKKGAHTSLSKYDMHNTLIAAGPHFKVGFVDQLPSGNIDVAPTILSLLKVPADSERKLDGRVLHEALVGDKEIPESVAKKQLLKREGMWSQYLNISSVGNSVYLDEGNGGMVKAK